MGLRDKELDSDGVVGEVIFPDADAVSGVAGAPFGAGLAQSGSLDPGRAMAGARAHNRWLAELCSHSPERRAGVAVVPILADGYAAVAEITRAAESGLRGGIMIPALWASYPPYHDRRYDKVWAACQDLQMPVHTHVGAAPQPEYGEHLGIYVTEVRWWGVRPLWFALWSGVFERFPGLRWGATECGAFWANDLLWLMDTRYLREHSAKKMSHLLEGDLTMPPRPTSTATVLSGPPPPSAGSWRGATRSGCPTCCGATTFRIRKGPGRTPGNGCGDRFGTSPSTRPARSWAWRRPRCTTSIWTHWLRWPGVWVLPRRTWAKTMR